MFFKAKYQLHTYKNNFDDTLWTCDYFLEQYQPAGKCKLHETCLMQGKNCID